MTTITLPTQLSPLQYLKADIASNYGIKGSWDDRLQWFKSNEPNLSEMIQEAKDPALYFAGLQSYQDVQKGLPSGYPVSFDASSSGLQLLSISAGCRSSALHCNVTPTGFCEDAYTNLYSILKSSSHYKTPPNLVRADIKDALMKALYGSTAEPKKIFKEDPYIDSFFACTQEIFPGAWELNVDIQKFWNPRAKVYKWIMPDGFTVEMPVTDLVEKPFSFFGNDYHVPVRENMPVKSSRSLGPNLIHAIDGFLARETIMRCSGDFFRQLEFRMTNVTPRVAHHVHMVDKLWDLYLQSGFLSSRILKYLDKHSVGIVNMKTIRNMTYTIPKVPFHVITIHDDFRAHPNNGTALRMMYNQLLFELANSNLLDFMIAQFDTRKIIYPRNDLIPSEILKSDYAIN